MGRLWKTARFVLEGSEIRTTRFPTGYTGVWKTLILDREFWEYGMPEQANIHQITTTGFPHPSLRCEGTRRRRRDTLFNCQGSDGIQNGSSIGKKRRWIASKQTTLSQAVEMPFVTFFLIWSSRASLFRVAPFGRKPVAQYRAKIDNQSRTYGERVVASVQETCVEFVET